jgi:hypothetical protein
MSPTFSPISLGGLTKATVTGTTGSPTIDSSTRAGKTIYTFTGSGTITISTPGTVESLVIGGGGGGGLNQPNPSNCGGGGGSSGGYVYNSVLYVQSGTYNVVIGGGGGSNASGSLSYFQNASISVGGICNGATPTGASVPISIQGFGGGSGSSGGGGGGGGGSSAAGSNNSSKNGGAGGAGTASSITGTSVTRAGG